MKTQHENILWVLYPKTPKKGGVYLYNLLQGDSSFVEFGSYDPDRDTWYVGARGDISCPVSNPTAWAEIPKGVDSYVQNEESSEYILYLRYLPYYDLIGYPLTISKLVSHLNATAQTLLQDMELNGDADKRITDMKFKTTHQHAEIETYIAVKIKREPK